MTSTEVSVRGAAVAIAARTSSDRRTTDESATFAR